MEGKVLLTLSKETKRNLDVLRRQCGYGSISRFTTDVMLAFGEVMQALDSYCSPSELHAVLSECRIAQERTRRPFIAEAALVGFATLLTLLEGECRPGSRAASVCRDWVEHLRSSPLPH